MTLGWPYRGYKRTKGLLLPSFEICLFSLCWEPHCFTILRSCFSSHRKHQNYKFFSLKGILKNSTNQPTNQPTHKCNNVVSLIGRQEIKALFRPWIRPSDPLLLLFVFSHTTAITWTAALSHPTLLILFYQAGEVHLPRHRDGSCESYPAQKKSPGYARVHSPARPVASAERPQVPLPLHCALQRAPPCTAAEVLCCLLTLWAGEVGNILGGAVQIRSGHPYGAPQASRSVISERVAAASLPGWPLLLQLLLLLRQRAAGHSLAQTLSVSRAHSHTLRAWPPLWETLTKASNQSVEWGWQWEVLTQHSGSRCSHFTAWLCNGSKLSARPLRNSQEIFPHWGKGSHAGSHDLQHTLGKQIKIPKGRIHPMLTFFLRLD